MKKIIKLLILVFVFQIGNTQICFDFEDSCSDYAYSFNNGCIPDWIASHGTPDTKSDYQHLNIFPISGDRYVHMYSESSQSVFPNGTNFRGEGVVLNEVFSKGKTYEITLKYLNTGGGGSGGNIYTSNENGLYLTDGVINSSNVSNDALLAIPQGSQKIGEIPLTTGNWLDFQLCFIPDRDYSQLWIRPAYMQSQGLPPNKSRDLYVDLVCVDELAPSFITTDAFGNPKSTFCADEDVFIKVDPVNYSYSALYLATWFPSVGAGWYNGLGWNFGLSDGIHNISQLIRDKGERPYEATFTFDIQLAVDHPDCGWVESSASFKYVCCENQSGFDSAVRLDPSTGNYTISGSTHQSGSGGTFCLYSDTNGDGQPDGTVGCQDGNTADFSGLPPCSSYFLVNHVENSCGYECSIFEFTTPCPGRNEEPVINPSKLSCDDFEKPCHMGTIQASCPVELIDPWRGYGTTLSWSTGSMNNGYEVRLIQNDPACGCKSGSGDVGRVYTVRRGSRIFIPIKESASCFSYQVRLLCPNGKGKWSNKVCFPQCRDGEPERGLAEYRFLENVVGSRSLEVFPNPFTNHLNIQFTSVIDATGTMVITDMLGRTVFNTTVTANEPIQWQPEAGTPGGMYIVTIQAGSELITEKVMYQER